MNRSSVDHLARGLLRQVGLQPHPPIDVERLAARLGVGTIDDARLIEDGRLEVGEDGIRLLVRSGLNTSRRRFTIAHELGHLLLMDPAEGTVARRLRSTTNDVERLCDDVAAALLMPHDWVRSRFAHRPQNLSSVRHLANQTGTSLSASIARLAEVLSWPKALLRWRLDGGRWRFVSGSGVPSWLHGHIRSAAATSRTLASIASRTRRDTRALIPVLLFDKSLELDAQVSVCGSSAIVLIDLKNWQKQLVPTARGAVSRLGLPPREQAIPRLA